MSRTKVIRSKVAGVTFEGRQKIIKKYCYDGAYLVAVPEPKNRHSPDGTAVGLWVEAGWRSRQMGYLGNELSGDVSKHLRQGGAASVQITAVTGGTRERPTRGVNIEIELIRSQAMQEVGRPASQAELPPFDLRLGDRLWVGRRVAGRAATAIIRGAVDGYRALPHWAQPIVWGVAWRQPWWRSPCWFVIRTTSSRTERVPDPTESRPLLDQVDRAFSVLRSQVVMTYGGHAANLALIAKARRRVSFAQAGFRACASQDHNWNTRKWRAIPSTRGVAGQL